MKIAAIQLKVFENDGPGALEAAEAAIGAHSDADLVILPELWQIGFMNFDAYHGAAEPLDGPFISKMRSLARQHGIFLHTGSFVEKDRDLFFNTSVLLSPGGEILAAYRKIHLFGHGSRETTLLSSGSTPVVAQTALGRFGLATCFDLRFPELFRTLVDAGAQAFLIASAWPYPRLEPWILFNRTRAVENQCYLISANSAGTNRGSQFAGHSMVVDPFGHVLAGAGDDPAVVRADIDIQAVETARNAFPGLAGRRRFLNPGMTPTAPDCL